VVPINQHSNNVPIVHAKVEQTKLPEFWGQKDKDSITANEFVKQVDRMMSANNWSDKIAFDNFGLAL
jgi:hypothetical protein